MNFYALASLRGSFLVFLTFLVTLRLFVRSPSWNYSLFEYLLFPSGCVTAGTLRGAFPEVYIPRNGRRDVN